MWLYVLIAVLLIAAIGMQVVYLRTYAAQVTATTKAVVYVNVGLLALVLIVVIGLAVRSVVS